MMEIFGKGDLPNAPKGPFYDTDVASFRDINIYATRVDLSCVVLRHSAGYHVAGTSISSCLLERLCYFAKDEH